MNPIVPAVKGPPAALNPAEARLKKTALQLEGLFVQRMFAAMRDTVGQDGAISPGSAETTFTSMLDEKFAEQAPKQWNGEHSLGQALYNQLRRRLTATELAAGTTAAPAVPTDSPLPAGTRTPNTAP
jgi:flagellar protein FlgJ